MGYMMEIDAIPAHPPAMMSLAATVDIMDERRCTDRRNKGMEHRQQQQHSISGRQ